MGTITCEMVFEHLVALHLYLQTSSKSAAVRRRKDALEKQLDEEVRAVGGMERVNAWIRANRPEAAPKLKGVWF